VLDTFAFGVVPSDLPLRGPDMSLDMRLFAVSVGTADSDGFESMALGFDPLTWLQRVDDSSQYCRTRHPSLRQSELPATDGSLFTRD
jgi:hypothetical protein